jgi:hypothetical protein
MFSYILLDVRRIRIQEAQKRIDPTDSDPDPQHSLKASARDLSAGDGSADGPGGGQAANSWRPQPVLILRG